jgi:predicted GIY-YIG superfamily endonuclease
LSRCLLTLGENALLFGCCVGFKDVIVYLITNTKNQKRYVGITTGTLAQRWYEHYWLAANGKSQALCRSAECPLLAQCAWSRKASLIAPDNGRTLIEGYNDDVRLHRISRTIHAETQGWRVRRSVIVALPPQQRPYVSR